MNRKEKLLSLFDATGTGLEIGPSFNPLLPKADGYNIEIVDCLSAADLRKKYEGTPGVDLSKIEDVDYVCDGVSILEAVDKPNYYDFIIALHVLEHTPDPLGFFIDCERLLKDSGVLVLAVPDKRLTFDCLRPRSTTGQFLQAHMEKRKRHTPGAVFDEIAYNCHREGSIAWKREDRGALTFSSTLEKAKDVFEELQHHESINDIHAWQFTPSSFRLILSDLTEIGATGLKERSFHGTMGGEFFAVLSKLPSDGLHDRLSLAQYASNEEGESDVCQQYEQDRAIPNHMPLNSSRIVSLLGASAFLLVLASIGGQLIHFLAEYKHWLINLFNVELEQNIPTWFSVFLLLFAAGLLAVITALKRNQKDSHMLYWAVLTFGFLFMAIDEAVSIHEKLLLPSAQLLNHLGAIPGHYGIFAFAWVVPAIALIILFGLFFVKFLFNLTAKTRLRFLVAATLYIGGAIGMEMIGGRYVELHGSANMTYTMFSALEESLEMVGVIVFIRALLLYIADHYKEVRFHFNG
jgi:predicted SAM-dependent methyltransferase